MGFLRLLVYLPTVIKIGSNLLALYEANQSELKQLLTLLRGGFTTSADVNVVTRKLVTNINENTPDSQPRANLTI